MKNQRGFKIIFALAAIAVLVFAFALTSCSGNTQTGGAKSSNDEQVVKDMVTNYMNSIKIQDVETLVNMSGISMGTLLEPQKIVWGKFMHVFVHFFKFLIVGFIFLFLVSPFAQINVTLIFILLALNLAVGCFIISNRIYRSAKDALLKIHKKFSRDNGSPSVSQSVPMGVKILGWIDRGLVFAVIAFAFVQVQMILITNYFGDMSYYPRMVASLIGAHPLAFVVYLQIPFVLGLLIASTYYQKKTEKLLKDFI
jgi:hypothetical protein